MDRIHCVMPTYRPGLEGPHRHYRDNLQQALVSTCGALGPQDRLCVVQDGSPDGVQSFVRGLERVEHEVSLPQNQGTAQALNAGFETLEERYGPSLYRTWVSDDNVYDPDCFNVLASALDQHPDVVLVYAHHRVINQAGQVTQQVCQHGHNQPGETFLRRCRVGIAFLYRTDAAHRVGSYRFGTAQDWDYWLRLEEIGPTLLLRNRNLAAWRNHRDTTLHSGRLKDDTELVRAEAVKRRRQLGEVRVDNREIDF